MNIRGGRCRSVQVGAVSFGGPRTRGLTFTLVALALLLTGCRLPPPEVLDFKNDPRILRGTWTGWVDTHAQPGLIAVSADASTVAATWRNAIEVSVLASGELLTTVQAAEGRDFWLPDLALNGAGTLLAGIVNSQVSVWATGDGSLVSTFKSHGQFGACEGCGARHLELNPAGDLLAVAGTAQAVLVLGTDSGNVLTTLDTSGSEVGHVAFAADGTRLAAGSFTHVAGAETDYFLNVWSVPSFEPLLEIQGSFTPWDDVTFAFSADGTHMAASSSSKAYVHDLTGGVTAPTVHDPESARLLALSPDGQQGAFTVWREGNEHRIVVVDLKSGDALATFEPVRIERVGWSGDGGLLYVGSEFHTASDFQLTAEVLGVRCMTWS